MAAVVFKPINFQQVNAVLYTEQQLLLMGCLRQDILEQNLLWYLQLKINVDDKNIVGF